MSGPANLTLDELVAVAERATGRNARIGHAPPAAMRVMSTVLGPFKPVFADQLRAALMMDSADMRVGTTARVARFPEIPLTTADEVAARMFGPARAAAAISA